MAKLIRNSTKKFDIWNFNVIAKSFDVLLSPKSIKNYTLIFDSHSLNFIIIDDNIQKYFFIEIDFEIS